MKDKVVTLFGGGGFVGRYVAQALMAAGVRIRIAQRDPRQAFFLRPLGGLGQTQFVGADVTRPDTLRRAMDGADAAVNLVGSFTKTQAINADGARNVAEAAAASGMKALVQVSAIGADANSPAGYARSKAAGEAAVREAFANATIVRPATIFGPEDEFINRFAGMIETACALPLVHVLPVLRAGVKFQPVYVGDVAAAVLAALGDPDAYGGKTYEVGGPDVMTMIELHRWIADAIGRHPHFLELPDAAGALIAAMPGSPISGDQWKLLQRDTVVAPDAQGLAALGVTPTPLAAVAPAWLVRYRRNGRFGMRSAAA